jgi:hypothetical protein
MKYMVDIDGTICTTSITSNYEYAEPFINRITHFNSLYDQGHEIHYWTARGGTTNKDWSELTKKQLEKWKVKIHLNVCDSCKNYYVQSELLKVELGRFISNLQETPTHQMSDDKKKEIESAVLNELGL